MGTFRGLALDLSVPGGALLPVLGVSSLAVVPSHRRRGILSALMAHGLGAAVARGEAAAVLHSAEYPVYGRYGFAPATRHGGFTVDVTASGASARTWTPPPPSARPHRRRYAASARPCSTRPAGVGRAR